MDEKVDEPGGQHPSHGAQQPCPCDARPDHGENSHLEGVEDRRQKHVRATVHEPVAEQHEVLRRVRPEPLVRLDVGKRGQKDQSDDGGADEDHGQDPSLRSSVCSRSGAGTGRRSRLVHSRSVLLIQGGAACCASSSAWLDGAKLQPAGCLGKLRAIRVVSGTGAQPAPREDPALLDHRRHVLLVVADEHQGHVPLGGDAHYEGGDFGPPRAIERGEGLVEQQEAWAGKERPSESDALLFASRELSWVPVEQRPDAEEARDLAYVFHTGPRVCQVLTDGEMRKQHARLRRPADATLPRWHGGTSLVLPRLASEADRSVSPAFNAGEHSQKRAFPTPRRSDHCHRSCVRAQLDIELESAQGRGDGDVQRRWGVSKGRAPVPVFVSRHRSSIRRRCPWVSASYPRSARAARATLAPTRSQVRASPDGLSSSV